MTITFDTEGDSNRSSYPSMQKHVEEKNSSDFLNFWPTRSACELHTRLLGDWLSNKRVHSTLWYLLIIGHAGWTLLLVGQSKNRDSNRFTHISTNGLDGAMDRSYLSELPSGNWATLCLRTRMQQLMREKSAPKYSKTQKLSWFLLQCIWERENFTLGFATKKICFLWNNETPTFPSALSGDIFQWTDLSCNMSPATGIQSPVLEL